MVLDLDALQAKPAARFEAAGFGQVRGFAVGRPIFGAVARQWLKGEIGDQAGRDGRALRAAERQLGPAARKRADHSNMRSWGRGKPMPVRSARAARNPDRGWKRHTAWAGITGLLSFLPTARFVILALSPRDDGHRTKGSNRHERSCARAAAGPTR
ncbi:2-deoxy-5-keto-D-gluconate 6-phosphate aldolase domain-containing protein [Paracoccus sp. MKU1]|uniref:2-deoxy-5-keto-D-gluconate 6-phosphate aldolase domain-containing protein n=1 Tax=Paracoccus sp. MKU1 TaxID=1745182 RepID=UPI001EF0D53C|nr:DUF2090 domain-containing protein [Paracoccus sp. MKU1]